MKDSPLADVGNHRKAYPNIACTNVNASLIEDIEAWYGGVEMNRVGSPVSHAAGASLATYCFEAPVFSENEALYDMKIDPDDTNFAGLDTDRTLSLYSGGFYIHSKTAALQWGVETDDNNLVGFSAAETVTLDFT